jgi:hypothetical protein
MCEQPENETNDVAIINFQRDFGIISNVLLTIKKV